MIVLIIADSTDRDEMQHYAAFHQGLHCLLSIQRVKNLLSGHLQQLSSALSSAYKVWKA